MTTTSPLSWTRFLFSAFYETCGKGLTARVTTAKQPRRIRRRRRRLLVLVLILILLLSRHTIIVRRLVRHTNPRLGKHPLVQDPVPRHFRDDGSGTDDREEGVGFRRDGKVDGREEGREFRLIVGGGTDCVDVALQRGAGRGGASRR